MLTFGNSGGGFYGAQDALQTLLEINYLMDAGYSDTYLADLTIKDIGKLFVVLEEKSNLRALKEQGLS